MLNLLFKKVNNLTHSAWLNEGLTCLKSMMLAKGCLLCGKEGIQNICNKCAKKIELLRISVQNRCLRCGLPLNNNTQICKECVRNNYKFDETVAVFSYVDPIRQMIINYKFRQRLILAKWFANELACIVQQVNAPPPDIIVPVPLYATRLRERGFNQAWEIAKILAKKYGYEVNSNLLKRTRKTAEQRNLSHFKRYLNIKNAFSCEASVGGKRIAVIDDVLTTGATLSEIAGCLKDAGAASVVNWVIARTPL